MQWIWNAGNSRENRRKHGLDFETARLVFEDPLAASRPDDHAIEERWQTIGLIRNTVVIVAHTWPQADWQTGEQTGRIISARKATAHERKTYEEGNF